MKIAIVGSRKYQNRHNVIDFINDLPEDTIIVSGGAFGVDSVAERYALSKGLKVQVYQAEWDKNGKAAGPIRNTTIVENSESVAAFWDGKSKGTKDTIDKALRADHIKWVKVFKDV